ncbi:DsbA family protein [Amycolatopsis sp. H20-H5]|uniref:DsbA family protein n=1 Tax=Amycolatopsis sp. H20-H5 TaxID=3046309 RepID=UPI002DBC9180|nr:thioredoxin domain-containing protein [Amycolatopsis sp. H20-H5]MEC3978480.1 thioredoxin domain-containing protein [Amycolatopsis sp. H20-H5]
MGGAQRNERNKRQQAMASRSVAQARGTAGGDRKKTIGIVVAVVLVAAAVIGGVLWSNASKNATAGQTIDPGISKQLAAGVVEKRDGVVVTVGKPGAKASIDIYADFLCPICGTFQKTYGTQIEDQVNSGALQVKYHMVPLLNESSNPPGYSLDSANASLAAADAGKFTAFHDALFANQPEEGKRGFDKGQLIALGQGLGITDPKFTASITSGTYDQQLDAEFAKTLKDDNLAQTFPDGRRSFGTPTVAVNGKSIQVQDPSWLQKLVAGQS